MPQLPSVSVVIPAYNYEQYLAGALDSVIAQDYPFELFDVIVVDDESSDATPEIAAEYAARHPEHVRVLRQPNAGPMAAMNRGVAESRGEFVSFLDADDAWLPHKTIRQVTAAQERPDVTMVCSNMTIIDGDGIPNGDTVNDRFTEAPRTGFGDLLLDNCALSTAMLFPRAGFVPIPAGLNYMDWWLMLAASLRGRVIYLDEELGLYRVHGANRGASWRYNPTPRSAVRDVRRVLELKLTALRVFDLSSLRPDDVVRIWDGIERHNFDAMNAAETGFVETVTIDDQARAMAQAYVELADAALAAGDPATEMRLVLKSLAWNPFGLTHRLRLRGAARYAAEVEEKPHPFRGAVGHVVLAPLEELLADGHLFTAYAQAMAGAANVTLAIDATRLNEPEAMAALAALDAREHLSEREDIVSLAVIGEHDRAQQHRMVRDARAFYRGELPPAEDPLRERTFTPAMLGNLRDAILAASA